MEYSDMAVFAVIGASVLVGVLRGFVREAFALAAWAAAFLVAFQYSGVLADRMTEQVNLPSVRTAIAFGVLFVAVLAVGGLITYLVGLLVQKTGLSGTDRLLGGVFGAIRGLLLVLALIIAAGFTPIPKDPWWQSSRSIQALLPLADWAAEFLPGSVRNYLDLFGNGTEATIKT